MTTVEEYRALSDQATQAWRRSYAHEDEAMLVTAHLLARVIRDHYPRAATLLLEADGERAGHYDPGDVLDADGLVIAFDQEPWDLAGPDHSTNDVQVLVSDLEDDRDWTAHAPEDDDQPWIRRFDIAAVLAAPLPGGGS